MFLGSGDFHYRRQVDLPNATITVQIHVHSRASTQEAISLTDPALAQLRKAVPSMYVSVQIEFK